MTRSAQIGHISGPEAFQAAFSVSRETLTKLEVYADLLRRWQKTINLVAPSTLDDLWHRHFADSAQVWGLIPSPLGEKVGEARMRGEFPEAQQSTPSPRSSPQGERGTSRGEGEDSPSPLGEKVGEARMRGRSLDKAQLEHPLTPTLSPRGEGVQHFADFGSGAGFPGLVLAILAAGTGQTRHTLIESDSRKAAFLREVARETRVAVDILCERIESPQTVAKVAKVDVVTARALAPLPKMVPLLAPYFASTTIGFFLKGQSVMAEIEETARSWSFASRLIPSRTGASGSIVVISELARRV